MNANRLSGANGGAIQGLWIGERLSTMEHASIASFLRFGYEYRLYVFDEPRNVPRGTTLLDAAAIVPRDRVYRLQGALAAGGGSVTSFANIFRWKLLYEQGGFWADTDVILVRPLDFDDEYLFAAEADGSLRGRAAGLACRAFGFDPPSRAVNCFIKVPPRSALMHECLAYCLSRDFDAWANAPFGATGIAIFRAKIAELRLERHLLPVDYICPVDYWRAGRLLEDRPVPRGAYAVHLWNEVWRRNGWSKETARPGSMYGQLVAQAREGLPHGA